MYESCALWSSSFVVVKVKTSSPPNRLGHPWYVSLRSRLSHKAMQGTRHICSMAGPPCVPWLTAEERRAYTPTTKQGRRATKPG